MRRPLRKPPRHTRHGGISPLVIIGIGAFFAALALAVDTGHMWNARIELRNSADAACLAAALALVDDELLVPQSGVMARCVERGRAQAQIHARANPVLGQPHELDPNWRHEPLGDIVFGYLDGPRGTFHSATDVDDPAINAVRIIARRTRERGNPAGLFFARWLNLPSVDVIATATAMLDRDVIGFRPLPYKPSALVPIALLSDPSLANVAAWESQVGGRRLSPEDGHLESAPNEMIVRIPLAGESEAEAEPNGCFLQIGDTDWVELCRQVERGVTRSDLADTQGQFSLGWDNRLYVSGLDQAPAAADGRLASLLAALEGLQQSQQPRIWPLFHTILDEDETGELTVVVTGFVAARVASVEIAAAGEGTKDDTTRQELVLKLRPCMMSTGTAITDANRRLANPEVDISNAYICKVRLVE